MKKCSHCLIEKPLTDFHTDNKTRDKKHSRCKPCNATIARENEVSRRLADPVRFERQKANNTLKCNYGITLEQYEEMFLAQDGVCAICKEEQQQGIRLCVDHDHSCCPGSKSCGRCVRQLLCTRCNTTLGKVNEDVNLLQNMIDYIKNGGK